MPSIIPTAYDDVLNTLIAWGQSGLKENSTVIKSYLPPVKDPKTGVEVLVPATVFNTPPAEKSRDLTQKLLALPNEEPNVPSYTLDNGPKSSWGDPLPTINSLPSAPYAGSGISDFNPNSDDPNGPLTFIAYRTVPQGSLIEQIISIGNVTQKEYVDKITTLSTSGSGIGALLSLAMVDKNKQPLEKSTAADRVAGRINRALPRIVDRIEDARTVYATPPVSGADSDPMSDIRSLTKRVDLETLPVTGKAFIPSRYDLVATGVPCAIPGIINCVMTKYDSVDTAEKTYTYTRPVVKTYDPPKEYRDFAKQYGVEGVDQGEILYTIYGSDYDFAFLQDTSVDDAITRRDVI